jgi:hypothetical protein
MPGRVIDAALRFAARRRQCECPFRPAAPRPAVHPPFVAGNTANAARRISRGRAPPPFHRRLSLTADEMKKGEDI